MVGEGGGASARSGRRPATRRENENENEEEKEKQGSVRTGRANEGR